MAKEVKIVTFVHLDSEDPIREAEEELARLLNNGWRIVVAGGSGRTSHERAGFVIRVLSESKAREGEQRVATQVSRKSASSFPDYQ